VLIFSDRGRAYGLRVHEIPQAARASKGRSVANLVQMQPDEKVASMLVVPGVGGQTHVILVTERGMIKKSAASEFANARHTGIVAVGLTEDDRLVTAKAVDAGCPIILVTENGNAIRFSEEEVRPMGRSAQGVKAVKLSAKDRVVGMALVTEGCSILTATEKGFGKRTKEDEYPSFKRGGKGVIALRATERTGKLIGIRSILADDEVIMISDKGKFLRLKGSSVSVIGRNTQGVRLMNLDPGERLVSIAVLAEKEEENGNA
jgi:DNA gyrase subunit A